MDLDGQPYAADLDGQQDSSQHNVARQTLGTGGGKRRLTLLAACAISLATSAASSFPTSRTVSIEGLFRQ